MATRRGTEFGSGSAESIEALYSLHESGGLGTTDERWLRVKDILSLIAKQEVRRVARAIYGSTLDDRIDDVTYSLFNKFLQLKFTPRQRPVHVLLRVSARRDLISAFRRSRSPAATSYDGRERTWVIPQNPRQATQFDIFKTVSEHLQPFRFHEHSFARQGVLLYFAANGRYPGENFVQHFGVPRADSRVVYNAALVDLNLAMMGLVNAG